MYAIYNYKVGATTSEVLSDIVAILTGTTNVASLSASCVAANTAIDASLQVAGWTVFDAAAGTNKQMLTALCQDGTTSKYWSIQLTAATTFVCTTPETWNATTHTGTNTVTTGNGSWDATNGGYFYIYASQKNIVLMSWTTTGAFRGLTGACMEFTRVTIPSTYPCWNLSTLGGGSFPTMSLTSGTQSWGIPRIKNLSSAGDTTGASTVPATNCGPICNAGGPSGSYGNGLYRDAAENQFIQLYEIGLNFGGVFLGQNYDVKYAGVSGINVLDTLSYSGTTYVAFGITGGGTWVWVPKG